VSERVLCTDTGRGRTTADHTVAVVVDTTKHLLHVVDVAVILGLVTEVHGTFVIIIIIIIIIHRVLLPALHTGVKSDSCGEIHGSSAPAVTARIPRLLL